jgi:hypothetical protein
MPREGWGRRPDLRGRRVFAMREQISAGTDGGRTAPRYRGRLACLGDGGLRRVERRQGDPPTTATAAAAAAARER